MYTFSKRYSPQVLCVDSIAFCMPFADFDQLWEMCQEIFNSSQREAQLQYPRPPPMRSRLKKLIKLP